MATFHYLESYLGKMAVEKMDQKVGEKMGQETGQALAEAGKAQETGQAVVKKGQEMVQAVERMDLAMDQVEE